MFLNKELVQYNNKLYWVYKKFKSSSIKEGKINNVKDLWNCDIVLKTRNDSDELLFLREIPEIELVN
jgi:hypothetical protein